MSIGYARNAVILLILDDVKLGIDYPTLESTYEDEEESYDPEAEYEDAYRRNEEFPGVNYDELYEEE